MASLMETTILAALKEKAPALHQQMTEAGTLRAFVADQEEEINEQIATLGMKLAIKQGAFKTPELPLVEKAAILNRADKMATEIVLAEMLQFPLDETSPPSQDATTPSAMAT